MIDALDIRVRGIVQGVGFRPFVYRLAKRYLVSGWVLNDLDGVFIHAEAEGPLLDEFVAELHMDPPAAARISEVELKEVPLQDCKGFEIRESVTADVQETTLVSADLGICDDCLCELLDPADRRYRYPFINCTNCGPRFTIIDALPYDRPATSMRGFSMCDDCAAEYADPADRRFHAQPDACFECGPRVSFGITRIGASRWSAEVGKDGSLLVREKGDLAVEASLQRFEESSSEKASASSEDVPTPYESASMSSESISASCESASAFRENALLSDGLDDVSQFSKGLYWGSGQKGSDSVFQVCVEILAAGGIIAVKGLGGFHLVCDACNEAAIAELRRRKRRDGKALAVLAADMEAVRRVCLATPEEEALLKSSARPIVLLRKRPDAQIAAGLADKLPELGVMLAATPVQVLLAHDYRESAGSGLLVMTSGNVHDEPIVTDDGEAFEKLGGIADAVLGNDREILSRYDDSVARVIDLGGENEHGEPNYAVQLIRRARGFAPVPLSVSISGEEPRREGKPTLFAAGPEQKNTFTFLREGKAFVSQHIGDMEDADVNDAWLEAKRRFQKLFDVEPHVLACDMHPEYLASKWARAEAFRSGLVCTEVQHHHAHIASVLGEHGLFGPCCGIAFDGTGYGADGVIWGGEVLIANQVDYERFANFTYVPMPGGAAAIKHPLRMAYGALWAYDLIDHPGARAVLDALGDQATVLDQMIDAGLNTPYTSSVGRLFDAVSAILGVCTEPTYEGEAAILLDAVRTSQLSSATAPISAEQPLPATQASAEQSLSATQAASSPHIERGADEPPSCHPERAVQCKTEGSPRSGQPEMPPANDERYAVLITKNAATETSTAHDTSVVLLDAEPTLRAVLDDLVAGVSPSEISQRFHRAIVDAIVQVAELVRAMYDINLVALSGGCFMNRYLVEESSRKLGERGFTVAVNGNLPPNDGCVSFGQAVVAAASR